MSVHSKLSCVYAGNSIKSKGEMCVKLLLKNYMVCTALIKRLDSLHVFIHCRDTTKTRAIITTRHKRKVAFTFIFSSLDK